MAEQASTRPTSVRLAAPVAELREAFGSLQTRADVADLLEVRLVDVHWFGVRMKLGRYRSFGIRKRSGTDYRWIDEPTPGLKIVQQKLLQVLSAVYEPHRAAHGFVRGRSIATNAAVHEGMSELLNIDLKDFFGTVNFGRVWGLLQAPPYSLPYDVATLLAQLTTHENRLPQGAPTSPILANMVARSLDRELALASSRRRLRYTRYADDITFSGRRIPSSWLESDPRPAGRARISNELEQLVVDQGFSVNHQKTRFASGTHRKVVTGLVVNERVNVPRRFLRQLRARLHAWSKYGEEAAQAEWVDARDRRDGETPRFRDVVLGQLDLLAMVRGNDDPLYERYYQEYCRLSESTYVRVDHRPWNHLVRPEDAVWVLECPETHYQGTGFFLDGWGLVTCAHVLGTATEAYPASRPRLRVPVRLLAEDREADIAVLAIDREPPYQLVGLPAPRPGRHQHLRLLGYPDHQEGDALTVVPTQVAGARSFGDVERLTLVTATHKGMSGGPVLDRLHRVVGIAATNPNLYNSVIPIAALERLSDFGFAR